jgi:hypothetical protein
VSHCVQVLIPWGCIAIEAWSSICPGERIKLKYEGGGVVQDILELFHEFSKLKLGRASFDLS